MNPSSSATLKNFKAINIQDLKLFKMSKIGDAKERIEHVHRQLKQEQGLGNQLINLHALEQHLPCSMRENFLNIDEHTPMLGCLATLNATFVPVLDYLISFKSELGLCLQRMIESYNLILLAQFKNYQKTENAKSKEYSEKIFHVDTQIRDLFEQKTKIKSQQSMVETLIQTKDNYIAELEERVSTAEKNEKEIRDFLESQKQADLADIYAD